MSRKTIALVRTILSLQLNHWIFVAAVVSALGLLGIENSHIWLWIGAGVLPVGMYFLRVRTKRIFVFFASHLCILIVGAFIPMKLDVKIMFVGMLIVYSILSVRRKLSENPEKVELMSPLVFIVVIGIMTFKNHMYTAQCFGVAWAYLLGYFLNHFLSVFLNFVVIHEKSASNMPEKELFLQGLKQMGAFSGIALLFIVFTYDTDWLAKIISTLGDWLLAVIRFLLSGLGKAIDNMEIGMQTGAPAVDMSQGDYLPKPEYSEAWLMFQKILEVFYKVLVLVIIAAIIFYGVRFLVRYIRENFMKVGKKTTQTILSNQDIRESCYTEVKPKEKRKFLGFLSNEQRIRAVYRKRMLQEQDKIVGTGTQQSLNYMTAKECCEKIEASQLKEAYEKVRYSGEKVTAEDVRKAKG